MQRLDPLRVGRDLAPGIGAHQRVQAGERGFGDLHLRLERDPVQLLAQDGFDAHPRLRVVAVARYVDEAREEAPVRIASQEYAHAPPLVEIDDAA